MAKITYADKDNVSPQGSDARTWKHDNANEVKSVVNANSVLALKNCGTFDASVNEFPTADGTGVAGAIEVFDAWLIIVQGYVNNGVDTPVVLKVGDVVIARVNAASPDDPNEWIVISNSILGMNIVYCGECDLSTDALPTNTGTGFAGSILQGNEFLNIGDSVALLGRDGNTIPAGMMLRYVGTDPTDITSWILYSTIY
jgi:hypothetical protein